MSFWDLWHLHPIGVPIVLILGMLFAVISIETTCVTIFRSRSSK